MRIIYLPAVLVVPEPPTVELVSITNIASNGATILARIVSDGGSSVTSYQFIATAPGHLDVQKAVYPNGDGTFGWTFDTLDANVLYKIEAYVQNSAGASAASQYFTTSSTATIPLIELNSVSSIAHNGATVVSNVSSDGGSAITARGLNFYTNADYSGTPVTVSQNPQTGSYSSLVQTLLPATTYYARAWAQNSIGAAVSNVISFLTPSQVVVPTVVLNSISGVSLNDALYDATVSSDGGSYITSRGVNFYKNADFSGEYLTATHNTGGVGNYNGQILQLLPATTYYARAWAKNDRYTGYSSVTVFTTSTAEAVVIDIIEPDYIVLRYIWEEEDGKDLDTMTEFVASGVSGLDNKPVGYGSGFSPPVLGILHWGGDNRYSGQENVMIDITKLRTSPGVIETSIAEFSATWYEIKGPRHTCAIELKAYRGGTMSQVNIFEYQNNGGTLIYSSDSTVKSVDSYNTWEPPYNRTYQTFRTSYTKLGRLEYKKSTNRAKLIF